jgi:fructokinase
MGVIINGKPHHGMMHPEAGHIFMDRRPDDPLEQGVCPYHGNCLEGLASGPAIERRWGRKAQELSSCDAVWELESYYIALAVCDYIMILSPERIILGGGVMHQPQMLPLVRREVHRQLHGYLQGKGLDDLDNYIVPVSLGDNQGVMGAVKLAMDACAERGGR